MHYKYCPECGMKLIGKIAGDDGEVPYCQRCESYWFDTFPSCSIVMVVNEFHEVVLLSQKYLSDKYKTFVSGYITPGESAEESAFREVQEEIGVTLERLEPAGTFWFDLKGILMHGFIGYAKKCEFTLSSEVDKAEWVPVPKIWNQIFPESPGNTMYPLIRKYLGQFEK